MPSKRKFNPVIWLCVFVATVIAVYVAIIVFSAASMTVMLTRPLTGSICCQTPRGFGAEYENIEFRSADGVALSGWYIPPKNNAVVILLHGYYADRRQVLPVAKILVRHGYGILMYDQRATGESQGQVRSLGWLDIPDVEQAVAFVRSRPGAKNSLIGLYGCSVGGAVALVAAARDSSIAAVAVDAPSSLAFEEMHPNIGEPGWLISLPIYALYFPLVSLRTGAWPPTTTSQAIQHITPRPLLVISAGAERARADTLYALAGYPKTRWDIPEEGHCAGPLIRPDEYEQRLDNFFDESLLVRRP